jgi:hypothetical protein
LHTAGGNCLLWQFFIFILILLTGFCEYGPEFAGWNHEVDVSAHCPPVRLQR